MDKIPVALLMPQHEPVLVDGAARAYYCAPTAGRCLIRRIPVTSCGIGKVFNLLWGAAMQLADQGIVTHAAMLHSDVQAEDYWLDKLLDEMEKSGADVVSAVIPLKGPEGVTSTAIDDPDNPWRPLRRLCMREIVSLPKTFSAEDAGYPNNALLINTGCWLADLRKPFWRETDEEGVCRFYFEQIDRLRHVDGKWIIERQSEDWVASRMLAELGAVVRATYAVKVAHHGRAHWINQGAWGTWEEDKPAGAIVAAQQVGD